VGIAIPEEFYREEVRCGYPVSGAMKQVWAAQLRLYGVFRAVCEAHGIRHFIAYGNLLGAVRHRGFVPWDDDVDVFLFREDYEKLCAVAQSAFRPPCFFQNDRTEPGSHIAFSKLRDSNTTAVLDFEAPSRYEFNQGIALDIFPLDNAPEGPGALMRYRRRIAFLKKWTGTWARMFDAGRIRFGRRFWYVLLPPVLLVRGIIRLLRIPNLPCRLLERAMQSCNGRETSCLCMAGLGQVTPYPKACFAETVMLPFEFLEVPAPVGYEEILNREYGDWHRFVRGAAGGSMHEGVTYDTERPYTEYLRE